MAYAFSLSISPYLVFLIGHLVCKYQIIFLVHRIQMGPYSVPVSDMVGPCLSLSQDKKTITIMEQGFNPATKLLIV